jgi:hypothetical protein
LQTRRAVRLIAGRIVARSIAAARLCARASGRNAIMSWTITTEGIRSIHAVR